MVDPRADYIEALQKVRRLRDEQPLMHKAVLDVIKDAQGQALVAFHVNGETDPAKAGVVYHNSARVLNGVWAILQAPEGRIEALLTPPQGNDTPEQAGVLDAIRSKLRRLVGRN